MSRMRSIVGVVQRGLFLALGGAAARLEPRGDPRHMTRQFERGQLVWRAFVDAGSALRRSGRYDEADAMVARGLALFPGDKSLLYEHASSAHAAGRYTVAIERWEKALAADPDLAMCHAGLAANLRETGDLERAAVTIETALARFPVDLTVATEAARIADRSLRFDRSLPLWRRAAGTAQPAPEWLQGEIHALIRLVRFPEAEAALVAAKARFPQHPGLMAVEGILASERHEWPRALAIWTDYRRLFPDDDIGRDELEKARQQAPGRGAGASRHPGPTQPDTALLLSRFVSLGDGASLETLQADHGAGRTAPLHWARVGLDGLLDALGAGFVDLGDPAVTTVAAVADGRLLVTDRRWRIAWQAAGDETSMPDTSPEAVRQALAAIRTALMSDLAAADRIFVYRSAGLDANRLDALHGALRRFGSARLLHVQPAAPTAPTDFGGTAGDLVEVAPGRYVGFVERLGASDEDGVRNAAADEWIAICGKAALAAGLA